MASPDYPVSELCSPRPGNCTAFLCLWLQSAPRFYTVCDQAVRLPGGTSRLSFISAAAVFPGPSLLRDCGFDPLIPSGGGSDRAMVGAGCSQERLRDHAAANAQRLRLGASPPQKKFTRSFQGLWKITTHLAPGFTLNDLVPAQRMWLFSGVCWHPCLGGGGVHTASTRCPPSRGTASPLWPADPQTSLCSWRFTLPTSAPPGRTSVNAEGKPVYCVPNCGSGFKKARTAFWPQGRQAQSRQCTSPVSPRRFIISAPVWP
ncbi:uncharacterized protein LOC144614770 [Panthera onca]